MKDRESFKVAGTPCFAPGTAYGSFSSLSLRHILKMRTLFLPQR
jgi:hypothetical protein